MRRLRPTKLPRIIDLAEISQGYPDHDNVERLSAQVPSKLLAALNSTCKATQERRRVVVAAALFHYLSLPEQEQVDLAARYIDAWSSWERWSPTEVVDSDKKLK